MRLYCGIRLQSAGLVEVQLKLELREAFNLKDVPDLPSFLSLGLPATAEKVSAHQPVLKALHGLQAELSLPSTASPQLLK